MRTVSFEIRVEIEVSDDAPLKLTADFDADWGSLVVTDDHGKVYGGTPDDLVWSNVKQVG